MYKNQPQMYKYEFGSLLLPVGWTSFCLGFIALTPYIAILDKIHTSVHTARIIN